MRDRPEVSVLINNYNYGRYVADAVESALGQSYPRVQVVVVDDGSTDGSRQILAGYGARITPVLKENGGQASAFNAGFEACTGEVVCLLDADDLFHPAKVEEVVRILGSRPELGWCFHGLRRVPGEAGFQAGAPLPPGAVRVVDVRAALRRGRMPFEPPATSALSFTRELLARILPMPEEIRITSDNYLKWVALGLSPGALSSALLADQRIHGENAYTDRWDAEGLDLRVRVAAQSAGGLLCRHPELRRLARGLLIDALAVSGGLPRRSRGTADALEAALRRLPWLRRREVHARGRLRYLRRYRGRTGPP